MSFRRDESVSGSAATGAWSARMIVHHVRGTSYHPGNSRVVRFVGNDYAANMRFLRDIFACLWALSLLAAPLAVSEIPCADTPMAAASAGGDATEMASHTDHSHHQMESVSADTSADNGEDCSCCEQCSTVCAAPGFTPGTASAVHLDSRFPGDRHAVGDPVRHHPHPPPPAPFRPPILHS